MQEPSIYVFLYFIGGLHKIPLWTFTLTAWEGSECQGQCGGVARRASGPPTEIPAWCHQGCLQTHQWSQLWAPCLPQQLPCSGKHEGTDLFNSLLVAVYWIPDYFEGCLNILIEKSIMNGQEVHWFKWQLGFCKCMYWILWMPDYFERCLKYPNWKINYEWAGSLLV